MSNFDSPLGSKKNNRLQSAPMRNINIPNGDDDDDEPVNPFAKIEYKDNPDLYRQQSQSDFESQMLAAREEKRTGKQRVTNFGKNRIEMLLGMTRDTKEVDITDDLSFTLQTLKSKEIRNALLAASAYAGTVEYAFELRKQYLARSITHVSEVEISNFLGRDDFDTILFFIEEMSEPILDRLFTEYGILDEENKSKYAIKTPEEARELVEDLKK